MMAYQVKPTKMRINRYLAACGLASRRKAEQIVLDGRVTIDGEVVQSLSATVSETAKVCVDGTPVTPAVHLTYVLLNKPKGYVTTAQDERGRKTVLELIPDSPRVFPVGRLDINTTGLLLLTNDGELAHRLMHPRFKVAKIYRAGLDRDFSPDDMSKLTSGLILEDGPTQPCVARFFSDSRRQVEIELREGRQQQVRRMFAALTYHVETLNRVRFGCLDLQGLGRGQWRNLSPDEVSALKISVKLS